MVRTASCFVQKGANAFKNRAKSAGVKFLLTNFLDFG
jgi:hypothetical protein